MNTASKLSSALLIGMIALTPAASASTITVEVIRGYQMGYGGEFLATPSADWAYLLDSYDSKATLKNGFFTFCLEHEAPIPFNVAHNAALNNVVVGVGGRNGGSGSLDPLSNGTAWLYQQFALGTLDGYDYTPGDRSEAARLQSAIWWLEGEITAVNPYGNPFIQMATEHFGDAATTRADNDGSYGVMVLNLGNSPNFSVQDLLVYTGKPGDPMPVADRGHSMLLLAAGMMGMFLIKRRNTSVDLATA